MVALRIIIVVGVFAVVCGGAMGAPTVTYDQRQNGEYNVQVDVDGVAIVLLNAVEFGQRNAGIGDRVVHQIFGRRRNGAAAGDAPKPKRKKPAATCATTTTVQTTTPVTPAPEVPSYSELPKVSSVSTATQGYDDPVALSAASTQQGFDDLKPVSESFNPPDTYSQSVVSAVKADDYDPYSITPSTSEFFTQKVVSLETEEVTADATAVTAATAVKNIDNFVDNITSVLNSSEIPTNVQPTNSVSDDYEEKPISISSDVKTVDKPTNDETIQTGDTDDKSANEKTAVKIEDKPKEAVSGKITDEEPNFKAEEKQGEKTVENPADKNIKNPVESVEKSMQHDTEMVKNDDTEVKTNDNKSNEMVAMKTIEKPTFAEALTAVKNPEDDRTEAAVSSTDHGSSKNPTDMIALKTIDIPSNGDIVEKSAGNTKCTSFCTASTKVVEIQENKNTPRKPTVETIVSRTAPTLTEMVAVKTMENPATITTLKSVSSVKTVIKTGNAKTTSSLSSNGSTIMRKVGDRRPLPSIALEVAPPKVV